MMFLSAVIPLTAACMLAMFGTGSCGGGCGGCGFAMGRLFMRLCFIEWLDWL